MPKRLIEAAMATSAKAPVPVQDVAASPDIRTFLHSEISPHFAVPRPLCVGLEASAKGEGGSKV